MILKTATFLYKTISAYWYTINHGIQTHGKSFNSNKLKQSENLHLTKILKVRFFDHCHITST